jgi:hypothetical protein
MSVHVFGIRHHGPGCARSLSTALRTLAPDAVLVEGPPDAEPVLSLVAAEGMVPPVAVLVHAVDDPQNCSFYPFAEFSPEWQALRFAFERGVPARFIDLPCQHSLAMRKPATERDEESATETSSAEAPAESDDDDEGLREDPIGILAEAAGFADREQWWDMQVEQRRDGAGLFEGILDAMAALREGQTAPSRRNDQREAHMRTAIRAAEKEGFARIAVVCGAWHAPKLAAPGSAKQDAELLKGLPKTKVAVTWIPWTYSRLSFRSGYGAGVESPGWYEHVWKHEGRAPVVWATLAARLLREQDLDASAANAIETVRLATALASVRELPAPGLAELREAIEAVLCGGERARMALIRAKLEVGEALGEVPEHAGQVPIARDFEREAKRLRLKLSTAQTPLDLDLRKDTDRDKSRLLHRLSILGVDWGKVVASGKGAGTFREGWQICWRPELMVDLIAANIHGNTVEAAATAALGARAAKAELSEVTSLVELAIVAHLSPALDVLLDLLDARAAASSDVRQQMEAVLPLTRVVRYSDVRATRGEHLLPVIKALFERIVVGLVLASTHLADDAAAAMILAIDGAQAACLLLDDPTIKSDWLEALGKLADAPGVHARIGGRTCRILLEQRVLSREELARRAALALGRAVDPADAARWIEGLVAGEGLLLVHQEELLVTLDEWLASLADDVFQAELPLLRRAFAGLSPIERRQVAERVKQKGGPGRPKAVRSDAEALDEARAARVLPVLARILGGSRE